MVNPLNRLPNIVRLLKYVFVRYSEENVLSETEAVTEKAVNTEIVKKYTYLYMSTAHEVEGIAP